MAKEQTISQDLYDLLITRGFEPEPTDQQGKPSQPAQARVFSFDWVSTSGINYGTAVAVITDDRELMLFFGDNLGKSMDESDKDEWFEFLRQLGQFSTRHDFHTFSPRNLNQLKHTMAGMAAIKEGLFEGYYGTRQVSYMGEPTEARLMIRHNRNLGEGDARHRHIQALFIETQEGERFRLPFVSLMGGRAMLEHVRHGGRPYDIRGAHIANMIQEAKLLSRFRRASQGRVLEGVTQEVTSRADVYYQNLRENLRSLGHARGYQTYFETWTPDELAQSDSLVEDLKQLFVEQTLDQRIEEALPILARIQGTAMKEADIFESWINNLAEGTWAVPDTPEAKKKLNELLTQEIPVGPDATNATEQLYDLFGDDELFDRLGELADRDPDADARDVIRGRASELGIDLDEPAAEPAPETDAEPAPSEQDQTRQPAPGQQDTEQVDESQDFNKPYGVRYRVFAGREGRLATKEAWFKTSQAMERGIEKLQNSDNFYEVVAYSLPDANTNETRNPVSNSQERELVKKGILPSGAEAEHYRKQMGRAGKVSTRQMKSLEKGKRPGGPNEREYANRMHSDDPAPMEEGDYSDSELYNGCYVRDEQAGPRSEVFRMTGDPSERSVRIDDQQGRGWYIHPSRLTLVDEDDPAVAQWFGGSDDDLDEGDNLATFEQDAQRTDEIFADRKQENHGNGVTADQLEVNDDVIITGPVEFEGATGIIDSFGRDKRFVVVNLYNHGKHSFHSSDVEGNDYADSDQEEHELNRYGERDSGLFGDDDRDDDDMKEDSTDAMDHRGAVTDSFTEDLARLKSLALSK